MPIKVMVPRISVFVALDNFGEVYMSLSQDNTDTRNMILFLHHLIIQLDYKNPLWRNNTLLQLDGAAYHKQSETLEFLKQQNVQTLISAPYSYDTAPCELFFAYLKNQNLNPDYNTTKKR